MIAQRILVRAADAGPRIVTAALEARRRVVLDDEILPVGKPHRAIRADLREDRRHPFIAARDEIESVVRHVARAVRLHVHERR